MAILETMSVCQQLCAKNFQTDLHEIFTEGWQWTSEKKINFCWQSGSGIRVRIRINVRIGRLVRHALAEVCTVSVLLVFK